MALQSRLGAFMVGTALGAAQCFYWLHEDVQTVQTALSRKIATVSALLEDKDKQAAVRLAAMQDAAPKCSSPAQAAVESVSVSAPAST